MDSRSVELCRRSFLKQIFSSRLWIVIAVSMLGACTHPTSVRGTTCSQDGWISGYKCKQATSVDELVDITVNTSAKLVSVTHHYGPHDWNCPGCGDQRQIFEHCSIVTENDWECRPPPGSSSNPIIMTVGMFQGTYYASLTGGAGPDYYHSSIIGVPFWLDYWGLEPIKPDLPKPRGKAAPSGGRVPQDI